MDALLVLLIYHHPPIKKIQSQSAPERRKKSAAKTTHVALCQIGHDSQCPLRQTHTFDILADNVKDYKTFPAKKQTAGVQINQRRGVAYAGNINPMQIAEHCQTTQKSKPEQNECKQSQQRTESLFLQTFGDRNASAAKPRRTSTFAFAKRNILGAR